MTTAPSTGHAPDGSSPADGWTTRRRLRAVLDTIPVALSIAPFGLVIGATAAQTGVPIALNTGAAVTVFSGAAHLAALTTLAAGAGLLTVVGTAALINARLLLYSASIEPRFRDQPRWFRWLGPALLIDQTFVMVLGRDDLDDPARFRRYWLTAGGVLMASWVAMVGLGGVLGPLLPVGSPLDAAAVAVLAGMLAPRLTTSRPAIVALAALVVAVVAAPLPGGLGLAAGIAAGLLAGALLDGRSR
ncbi:MAG: AzlC family ABC transporter permease [Pseudonocardia sp.]